MNTLDFLRLILPADGLKAAFFLPAKRHGWTNSLEELAEVLEHQDDQGVTVYHACAAFTQGSIHRTQANAMGAKSFWLDIDAGDSKPYATARDAALAVGIFAGQVGLPIPLMLASGAGIHAYWPLTEIAPKAEWHLYATGLKALCEEHGLHADPARTADIASILRPVGTHNHKRGGALVRCVYEAGPFTLAQMSVCAGKGRPLRERKVVQADPLTASLMHVQDFQKVYAEDLADSCAMVGWLREAEGQVPEPVWHQLAGVLRFTEDGEATAIGWADPGYEVEIRHKFARAASLTGPPSCEAIQGVAGSERCKGCPLFNQGRNPTMARRPLEQPKKTAPESPLFAPPEGEDDPEGETDWPIPEPFRLDGNSLIYEQTTKEGKLDLTVCEHAVLLKGTARAEAADDRYSYVFARYDPRGNCFREFTLPAKAVMSSGGLSDIAGRGGAIQQTDKFMQYLRAAVPMVQSSEDEMIKYEQFGWKEGGTAFLFGNRLYTADGLVPAVGSPDVEGKSQSMRPRSGSLAEWGRVASRMFAAGAEAQSLVLLASFAAPLMKFQSADEGGAVLSMVGQSGSGKSTALAAASSVWGRDKGVTIKNDDTYNAKFIALGVLCNLPVIYDEVHATDPEIIKRLIITFTNGSDRARGTTDGSLVNRSNSWQTLMITGSNPSLVELIGSLPGSDAAGKRIFELVTKLPVGADHKSGDEMKRQFELNAGWAGDAFLKMLMEPGVMPYVVMALKKYTDDIWTKTRLPSEYRFWVRSLGAIAVAAVLVNRMGVIDFSPQRIIQWAINEMREQADVMVKSTRSPAAVIAQFLNEHINDTLVVRHEFRHKDLTNATLRSPSRQLFIRYETENRIIYIDETKLKRWVMLQGGGNFREVLEGLRIENIAKRGVFKKALGAGTDTPSGQVPVIVIDATRPEFSGVLAEARQEGNVINLKKQGA